LEENENMFFLFHDVYVNGLKLMVNSGSNRIKKGLGSR
jgi:hypothetical protein